MFNNVHDRYLLSRWIHGFPGCLFPTYNFSCRLTKHFHPTWPRPSNVADQAFSDTARSLNRLVPFHSPTICFRLSLEILESLSLRSISPFAPFVMQICVCFVSLFFTQLYIQSFRGSLNNCKMKKFYIFLTIIPQERINKFILIEDFRYWKFRLRIKSLQQYLQYLPIINLTVSLQFSKFSKTKQIH